MMLSERWFAASLWLLLGSTLQHESVVAFLPRPHQNPIPFGLLRAPVAGTRPLAGESLVRRRATFIIPDDDNDEDDDNDDKEEEEEDEEEEEEDEPEDPYTQKAASEFFKAETNSTSSSLAGPRTTMDWGGALGTLRERVSDVESGVSQDPSNALFRLMTSQTPNQAIGNFVNSANPQVVSAMSGAVNSLLGGLSNPAMGVETVIKASGERIGSLCFQLQMTGYMFRNAEYVLALKEIMKIRGSASLQEYKDAFDRLDTDQSGFIEAAEVEALLQDVYDKGKPPAFEVNAFLQFFDSNKDGKISWEEFERGLGDLTSKQAAKAVSAGLLLPELHAEDDFDDDVDIHVEANVSGILEIELQDGEILEVEATEYIESLKKEAQELKEVLRREKGLTSPGGPANGSMMPGLSSMKAPPSDQIAGGIAGYLESRQGDVKSLTEGISPEVMETMKRLVEFVLEGGPSKRMKDKEGSDKQDELEIPGAALQQLALWQLILGYRLREAEATGDYLKLMEH